MDIVQAITLAFIQGFTEFLPVSSSAHLIVLPKFLDWPDQGLAFDVILHFATLCAVVLYYRSTLVMLGADFFFVRAITLKTSPIAPGITSCFIS